MPGLNFKMYEDIAYKEPLIVRSARLFATWAHDGQRRKTGGPYILHPARVAAQGVADGWDRDLIAAAWLHDVVEDCEVERRTIGTHFGAHIEYLVDGLTDRFIPSYYPDRNRAWRKESEALRLANESLEVRTIKRADMADNLRDIHRFDAGFAAIFVSEKERLLELFDEADSLECYK